MGRRTYEFGLQFGVTNPYPWMRQYVFSRTMGKSPDPNIELVSENIIDIVRELKKETGKDIYLCGGAELAATLFTENLVDEIILKLNPARTLSNNRCTAARASGLSITTKGGRVPGEHDR